MSVSYSALCQVVGREFHINAVTHQDADAVSAHAAGDSGKYNMVAVIYLYLKISVWLFIDNNAPKGNKFFFHTLIQKTSISCWKGFYLIGPKEPEPFFGELPMMRSLGRMFTMKQKEIMTRADIHAFGVEIVYKQLEKDGWAIDSADVLADAALEPQIIAKKEGELAFFIVRTDVYPKRGRFEEGQAAFDTLVRHAKAHGATCYFASVGIANSEGKTEEEMSVPVKGVGYHVQFDGLIRMELAPEIPMVSNGNSMTDK